MLQFLSFFALLLLKMKPYSVLQKMASFPEMGEAILYMPQHRDFLILTIDFLGMH